jgi:SAM-dependent methyltransferase
MQDYLEVNRSLWNKRTDVHLGSLFYDVEAFVKGRQSLNEIELNLLGEIAGKNVLHLQCHFGQDTISLQRLGAKATGVDLSDRSVSAARDLTERTGTDAQFICCDVYELPTRLDGAFDIVFASYGAIPWLPDLDRWAAVVYRALKPGGRLVFVEFHPVVWMFDGDFASIGYSYFNTGAIAETETGTYADPDADFTAQSVTWNHAISEVVSSLIGSGLALKSFEEFSYSPYNCFRHTVEVAPRKYRISHLGDKIPMVYALVACRTE